VRFAPGYPILAARLAGVVQRDAKNIISDPYSDAFDENYRSWERKWEAGGPAWPFLLAWTYWNTTNDRVIFTPELHKAMQTIVDTWRCEQLHATCSRYSWPEPKYTHAAFNANTGMIWTAFRPSDDPVTYRFNIPQEALVYVALQKIAELAQAGYGDQNLYNEATSIAAAIYGGIIQYGRVWNPQYGGWVYVYETDGLGHVTFMDDANIPNLTALPYIGFCSPYDPTYLNTRKYALSKRNPWYFSGRYAEGLGSPHTPYGFVWPLGIMARSLTATSSLETEQGITTLAETDSETGLLHESFYPDGYWVYTREYFGWANALYAELLFRSVAGFEASPFGATPTITRPLAQFIDTTKIYSTLNRLLAEANGNASIPRIAQAMEKHHVRSAPLRWRELQDARDPIILQNGVPVP
jgi:meiotically up-regulated gene 157 (Mug157) protein